MLRGYVDVRSLGRSGALFRESRGEVVGSKPASPTTLVLVTGGARRWTTLAAPSHRARIARAT